MESQNLGYLDDIWPQYEFEVDPNSQTPSDGSLTDLEPMLLDGEDDLHEGQASSQSSSEGSSTDLEPMLLDGEDDLCDDGCISPGLYRLLQLESEGEVSQQTASPFPEPSSPSAGPSHRAALSRWGTRTDEVRGPRRSLHDHLCIRRHSGQGERREICAARS